jgi:hypothetical protein
MGMMAEDAARSRCMRRPVPARQAFPGMASDAIRFDGLDPRMGLVAFVTVQTRHGRIFRERCL